MARVKRAVAARKRHKKILKLTKGYRHGRKNLIKRAKEAVLKAGVYSYRDRKVRKRNFRSLWIVRISGALTPYELNYSQFIRGLKLAKINLNRKMLSQIAQEDEKIFSQLAQKAKQAISSSKSETVSTKV